MSNSTGPSQGRGSSIPQVQFARSGGWEAYLWPGGMEGVVKRAENNIDGRFHISVGRTLVSLTQLAVACLQ